MILLQIADARLYCDRLEIKSPFFGASTTTPAQLATPHVPPLNIWLNLFPKGCQSE
jgi:hypothetical protein